MNLLETALSAIQGLIKNERVNVLEFEITEAGGFAKQVLKQNIETYAHIQAITPQELKKETDSTLDSNVAFRFYFLNDYVKIINSLHYPYSQNLIEWEGLYFKIYALRDWYRLNGWVACYATQTKITKEELENGKGIQ